MNALRRFIGVVNKILVFFAGLALLGMIGLTCANIFSRLVYVPVRGTFELMGYGGAVVAALALGYTQTKKGHIAVDILVSAFPRPVQMVLEAVNNLLCGFFFALVGWQITVKGQVLNAAGEVSETLRIPYHQVMYAVALGCAVLALIMLIDFFRGILPGREKKS